MLVGVNNWLFIAVLVLSFHCIHVVVSPPLKCKCKSYTCCSEVSVGVFFKQETDVSLGVSLGVSVDVYVHLGISGSQCLVWCLLLSVSVKRGSTLIKPSSLNTAFA